MAKDSFDPDARTPTSIGELCITLYVTKDAEGAFTYRDYYSFPILDADGEAIERREGGLRPYALGWTLTQGQKNALAACDTVADVLRLMLDFFHAKAEGAVG
jgi:hypothetical protein